MKYYIGYDIGAISVNRAIIDTEKRIIDVPINILDISVANKVLCWEPKFSLFNGIKNILDHDYLGSF